MVQLMWKVSDKSVRLFIDDTDLTVKRRICHHRFHAQVLGINPGLICIIAGAEFICVTLIYVPYLLRAVFHQVERVT